MNGPDVLEILWGISRGESGYDGIPEEVRARLAADGLVSLAAGRPVLTHRAARMLSDGEAELRRAIDPGGGAYVPVSEPRTPSSVSKS